MLSDIFVPGGTDAEREAWARQQRESTDPETAAELYELVYSFDSTRAAPHVAAPALVLHRRDDAAVSFDLGRELAASLPNAQFVPLDGTRHLPWYGDTESVIEESLDFLRINVPTDSSLLPLARRDPPSAPFRALHCARSHRDG